MESNETTERKGSTDSFKITDNTAALLECKRLLNTTQDAVIKALQSFYGEEAGTTRAEELQEAFRAIDGELNYTLICSIDEAMALKDGEV